jgi:hypothetical protein
VNTTYYLAYQNYITLPQIFSLSILVPSILMYNFSNSITINNISVKQYNFSFIQSTSYNNFTFMINYTSIINNMSNINISINMNNPNIAGLLPPFYIT